MKYTADIFALATAAVFFMVGGPHGEVTAKVVGINRGALEDNRYCTPQGTWIGPRMDGPAHLPTACMNTALANTPSPGKLTLLQSGADLNAAMAAANCGDTIQLAAGGTFNVPARGGDFPQRVLQKILPGRTQPGWPAKTCDNAHWITVETSGIASLPPAGVRATPCYAGVASLRGRPAYPCASAKNVMAKILLTGSSSGNPYFLYLMNPFTFANNANHYRFIGLEIARPEGVGSVQGSLVEFTGTSGVTKIIFDRCWIHGGDDQTPNNETAHGINLGPSTYVALIDSTITDIWCIAGVGECNQANNGAGVFDNAGQTFWGGYKIVNNWIEAAGENWFDGGDAAHAFPTDMEVRRNYFEKPLIWNPYHPKFDGGGSLGGKKGKIVVENLGENKNIQRMLWEGNIAENSWAGFSQYATGFSLFPANQIGGAGGPGPYHCLAPHARNVDIVYRYNQVSNTGVAFNIATVSSDSTAPGAYCPSEFLNSVSFHDDVFDHIRWPYAGCAHDECSGYFVELLDGSGGAPHNLHDITINHLTQVLDPGGNRGTSWYVTGSAAPNQMYNWVLKNSIFPTGEYGIMTDGCGGGKYAPSTPVLAACIRNPVFGNNLIPFAVNGFGGKFTSLGHGGPVIPVADQNAVKYVNLSGGNYHLAAGSPGKGKADDGKDIGADIDLVNKYTCGVKTGDARGCP